MAIPSEQECFELLAEAGVVPAIVNHSIAVKNTALRFADELEGKGKEVDRALMTAAALLHDIKKLDAQFCHGIEAGEFLRRRGFPEVAQVVEKHCLNNLDDPDLVPVTTEERLLMYADLRTSAGKMVSLDERFDYIRKRYRPKNPVRFQSYIDFAKGLEQDFFGEDEPKE